MSNAFDEAYFQRGDERGTQYRDYLQGAKGNRTYFEIAQTIAEVFRPKRALEIGCAVGAIVSHLNAFDIEAHGIDVSEWAVENKLHENVSVGSAETIPFDDGYFDVVYSVHALEHLTPAIKDASLSEISRVCNGFQFHMLPILESGPYVGDRFAHLLNLRTDPTHSLLFDKQWWTTQFSSLGWTDSELSLSILHDNEFYELSACQFVLCKTAPESSVFKRAAQHNHAVAGASWLALNGRPTCGLDVHVNRLKQA
jgi:ubiquinone/menaquinone biosynthesis C-methylase UbiE